MFKSRSIMKHIVQEILILIVAILLFSCSTKNTVKYISAEEKVVKEGNLLPRSPHRKSNKILHNMSVKSRILDQYAIWKGVPYHLGGSTKKGIDCSAFVQLTFREKFGLELPRSTLGQSEIGKPVPRSNLCVGDLVLFRANSKSRHIGIYIGNDQFVHASASSGVTISNLNKPYWKKRYSSARRVLNCS